MRFIALFLQFIEMMNEFWQLTLFQLGILSKEQYLDQRLFGPILLSVKLSQGAFWTSSAQTDPSD